MVTLSYSAYEGMANHQLLPLGTSWSLFRDLNENSGVVLLVQRQDLDSFVQWDLSIGSSQVLVMDPNTWYCQDPHSESCFLLLNESVIVSAEEFRRNIAIG